jgi:UDP-N-acetylmuramyl-tripeptide synthetase
LSQARAKGAVAAVIEREDAGFDGARVLVRSASRALGQIAANRYDRPADAMTMVGVTGTNGKTTCTYLIESLLAANGASPGVIGTVAYRTRAWTRPSPFTTPTSLLLHATLAEMRAGGASHIVMECSSHALALDRLEGVDFTVAAFTNLTQDHLDFHADMDAYAAAKARLFHERLRAAGTAVVCVDGPHGAAMARASRAKILRVSVRENGGDVCVREARLRDDGTWLRLVTPVGVVEVQSPLVGAFNVENLCVCVGVGIALGLPSDAIVRALAEARGAPGRLERVERRDVPVVGFVDYAHTPDALERALGALRKTTRGKLWVVFGCGGDRDRKKRPIMGRVAADGADHLIVTSDNPRSEAPASILEQIVAGIPGGARVIEDRRAAIFAAVNDAAPNDVILVAGKGHEDYQIVGKERRHFDDREVLAEALFRRAEGAQKQG